MKRIDLRPCVFSDPLSPAVNSTNDSAHWKLCGKFETFSHWTTSFKPPIESLKSFPHSFPGRNGVYCAFYRHSHNVHSRSLIGNKNVHWASYENAHLGTSLGRYCITFPIVCRFVLKEFVKFYRILLRVIEISQMNWLIASAWNHLRLFRGCRSVS